ncbi:MAG TPA: hypothetical protein VH418_02950 [Solirubrobacteraceae bacterium]
MRRALVLAALLALCPAAAARAADPGRWRLVGTTSIPTAYWQGTTSSPDGRRLYFDGVFAGLFRTDRHLVQRAGRPVEIPAAVTAKYGFNHIGDITWNRGRVLLPLECYTAGAPNGGNTCGRGAFAVAEPVTLRWRYLVLLDRRAIAKAMWAETSPDGRLVWTSSGRDLLAYRSRDVARRHTRPLRPVRRLRRAVPPTGVTGAVFHRGRLLLAGQRGTDFEVWSVNLATGRRRLEIQRTLHGESEGLDVVRGVLHWIVTPADPTGGPPTFPGPRNTLLSFRPVRR